MATSDDFDAYYYRHCCGMPYVRNDAWLAFFGTIADRIVADMAPRRVLDAGCAMGFLVETLRTRGAEAWGIDLSPFAIESVHPPVKPFCRVGSITDDLGGDYDLIVSIEVAEHMPPRDAERAIANICAHTADVIFSSSPLDYREPTHVNVHQPEHWAELFARHGFFRDVDYDASYITPWAARFRKSGEPVHRLVRDYERRYWALAHESSDARAFSADTQRELAAAQASLEGSRAELESLRGELETLHAANETMRVQHEDQRGTLQANLDVTRNERDALRQGLDTVSEQLRQARDRIAHMERSAFWKARRLWLKLRAGGSGS